MKSVKLFGKQILLYYLCDRKRVKLHVAELFVTLLLTSSTFGLQASRSQTNFVERKVK